MKLIDLNDGREFSLPRLREEWEALRADDPENHAGTFKAELFEILMATVNGRNDCEVIGPTPAELSNMIMKLRRA